MLSLIRDTPFEVGTLICSLAPPQLTMLVVVKATFALRDGAPATIAASQRVCTGDLFFDGEASGPLLYESDYALLKKRGECVLQGSCRLKAPSTAAKVSFRVGPIERSAAVFGDRRWVRGPLGLSPTEPEPFLEMPLGYERAFGGAGFEPNPLGLGFDKKRLPNVEAIGQYIGSASDRPAPVAFGPIPRTWPARLRYTGTYDARWREERYPGLPEDFDIEYFQCAPREQQLEGFFVGDEAIELSNLCRGLPELRSRLPGLGARAFVERGEGAFEEIRLSLDTIAIDADRLEATCLWRGRAVTADESCSDLSALFVMHEALDAPTSAEQCRRRLEASLRAKRLEQAGFLAEAPSAGLRAETIRFARLYRGGLDLSKEVAESFGATVRVDLLGDEEDAGTLAFEGDDEEDTGTLAFEGGDEEDAGTLVLEGGASQAVRDLPPLDFSTAPEEEKAPEPPEEALGEPDLRLIEELAQGRDREPPPRLPASALRELLASVSSGKMGGEMGSPMSEALQGILGDLEAQEREEEEEDEPETEDREEDEPETLSGEEGDPLRARVLEAHAKGETLDGDFSGASLEGLDLRGLRVAPAAVFKGARMRGADLREACFDGAQLEGAVLREARLEGARLEGADLSRVDASGAALGGATLAGALLNSASLRGADLRGARLERAELRGADLEGANLEGAAAAKADFSGASLIEARLEGASLEGAWLNGARAARATLRGCALRGLRANDGADLREADLREVAAEGARFRDADLRGATFRGASLDRGDLSGADLRGADLSLCRLREARLHAARLGEARLLKSDLMRASLLEADLGGADLRGASLYEAELYRANVQGALFEGAILAGSKLAEGS